MNCPRCERANAPQNAYCGQCGAPLDPARGPAAYTPRHLAAVLAEPAALEGERKQLSVLFVDVVGSMELAERLDAEEWHRVLEGFFAILTAGVHRFEGTVNQYTGDGIMALFGAPHAQENHAERACFAALHMAEPLRQYAYELRRRADLDFVVRMGIHSGEAVVARIGDDLRMDYTAQGRTVGLAARITKLTQARGTCLSEATARLVSPSFELQDMGEFVLKGVREPVRAYSLGGLRRRPLRGGGPPSPAPGRFLGRANELTALDDAFQSLRGGKGQVIAVVGGAGLGKSRLCHEFLARCRSRGAALHRARCRPLGRRGGNRPMQGLFRSWFGIEADLPPSDARARVLQRLRADESLPPDAASRIFDFLGVPDPQRTRATLQPEDEARLLNGALEQILRATSAPAVLLLEDVHWLDADSHDLLARLIAAASAAPLLLLLTLRPDFRVPGLGAQHARLALGPLPASAADELIRERLGAGPAHERLARAVREHSGRHPLFLEELLRAVDASSDPCDLPLPARVHSVVSAQIDRLPARAKALVNVAAVVGEVFSARLLARVLGVPEAACLEEVRPLLEAELLAERPGRPGVLGFPYPIVRQAVCYSQLRPARARVHRAAAEAIEALIGSGEPGAAALPGHWEQAGELWKAADRSARAVRQAAKLAPGEAALRWQQVRGLLARCEASDASRALLLESCIEIVRSSRWLELPDAEVVRVYQQGRVVAEHGGNLDALARLDRAFGLYGLMRGSADAAALALQEAVRLASGDDRERERLSAQSLLVLAYGAAGRLDAALTLTEQIVAQVPKRSSGAAPKADADPPQSSGDGALRLRPRSRALLTRGCLLARQGRFDKAEASFARAERLAIRHSGGAVQGLAAQGRALLEWLRGDGPRAQAYALEAIHVLAGVGSDAVTARSYLRLGAAQILQGDCEAARSILERALDLVRRAPLLVSEVEVLARLADACLGAGDAARARSLAEQAVALARRRNLRLHECDALLALARIGTECDVRGRRAEIEDALARARDRLFETGARAYLPALERARTRLAAALPPRA